MPIPTRPTLTDGPLNRDWCADVNTGTDEAPVWTPVGGINSITPNHTVNFEDVADQSDDGASHTQPTGYDWGLDFSVNRGLIEGEHDPGQEVLRLASNTGERVGVRFYVDNPRLAEGAGEAYEGQVHVDWTPGGGGVRGVDTANVRLMGQGKRNSITHPGVVTP